MLYLLHYYRSFFFLVETNACYGCVCKTMVIIPMCLSYIYICLSNVACYLSFLYFWWLCTVMMVVYLIFFIFFLVSRFFFFNQVGVLCYVIFIIFLKKMFQFCNVGIEYCESLMMLWMLIERRLMMFMWRMGSLLLWSLISRYYLPIFFKLL